MTVRLYHFIFSILLIAVIFGCATTGPGGKQSVILIPTETEVSLGREMAQQVRAEYEMLPDSLWQEYINEIGQRIVAVSDRKDIEYNFAVIKSDEINAFAAPGGYIYFYTGLLEMMENEAELAAVMAHEISHVVARHSVKRLQAAMGASILYDLVMGENQSQALDIAVNLGMGMVFSGYSRSAEKEADEYGIIYMVEAGYNPGASKTMFQKLAQASSGEQNFFEQLFASHPETQERISNIESQIARMQPLSSSLVYNRDRYQRMKTRIQN